MWRASSNVISVISVWFELVITCRWTSWSSRMLWGPRRRPKLPINLLSSVRTCNILSSCAVLTENVNSWPFSVYYIQISIQCTVLSGVTIEAEPGITIYGQCWGWIDSAHCTDPLMCGRYVYAWVMCCPVPFTFTFTCSCYCSILLEEPAAVCLQYASWWPVSSSAGLYALPLTAPSGP